MEERLVFIIRKENFMNKKGFKKFLSLMALGLFMGVTVSCGSSKEVQQDTANVEKIVVTDMTGEVEVVKNPQRVVVFDYGLLDIIDNLGVEVVGLPKAALPKRFEKYEDKKYADLGGLKEPDYEAINALQPDLILLGGRQADLQEKFSEIAPTLLLNIDGSKYMEDVKRNVNTLSKVFGKEDVASSKLKNIEDKINEIKAIADEKDLSVLTLMVNEGAISTYGPGSRYGLIYNELGFKPEDENIEVSTHGQQVSFEYVVDKNPEYIFVIDRGAAIGGESTAKAILENELIKSTDAYKNGRILYLDSEAWYVISGGLNSTEIMLDEILDFVKSF